MFRVYLLSRADVTTHHDLCHDKAISILLLSYLQGCVVTPSSCVATLKAVLRFLRSAPYVVISNIPCCNVAISISLVFLVSIGFELSKSDASLFICITNMFHLYMLIYMDDIIITGNSNTEIDAFVNRVHTEFSLKDIGFLHYFLGIEVTQHKNSGLHLCQRKYVLDLLEHCHMDKAKGVPTPMISSCPLSKHICIPLVDPHEYHSNAGSLQYMVLTRLDIAYVVNRICQFMRSPTDVHFVITRPFKRLSLVGYVEAIWGFDFDDRHLTTSYCVYLGGNPVSWCFKK
ncbi:hypothetical protein EPI10_015482 [Gossypium australe]|uniref:Reverse transcriptase Ty1/copia-type domain-containing protein n=1 Tax=Gossypium australe TaxID=47621 RepID=A0A5B6VKW5_9ROSI|nr:hypothetical protein EPI10_015482 [Gossypium australe]